MKKVQNKLRVVHFPQVGASEKCFKVEVKDEDEAYVISQVIANQHLWLFDNNFIPDYANVIFVEMFDESIDEETNEPYGWSSYFNEEEGMEWEEFSNHYFEIETN